MSNQVKIYATQLRPRGIINLDQPCHFEEFYELPGYLHNSPEIFDKINERYLHHIDSTTRHWTRLLEHIDKWGIIYPIVVNTGVPKIRSLNSVPFEYRRTSSRFWTVCENQGGLRILAAEKLGIKVPTLVNDHTGLYEGQRQVTMRELAAMSEGIRQIFLSAGHGIRIGEYPRLHLNIDDLEYLHYKNEAIQATIAEYREWDTSSLLEERINTLQGIGYDSTDNQYWR